jgi:hypothetical protein
MNSLLLLIASWFSPVDMVPWVSANAAYTINTLCPLRGNNQVLWPL